MPVPRLSRWVRPALVAAATGATVYITYRPRTIPGSESAIVPPPTISPDGLVSPPKFPAPRSRHENIELLRASGATGSSGDKSVTSPNHDQQPYDLLIIGGGATGTGIALDAVTRGLKVALVERDDFSSGTSSKSTKLVHGGVRYLEKAVWELDYSQ